MICLFIYRTNGQNSVKRCWSNALWKCWWTVCQIHCENTGELSTRNAVKMLVWTSQPETVRLWRSYPGLQDDTEWINMSVLRLTSAVSLRDRSCAKGQTKQNKKSQKSLLTTRELEQSSWEGWAAANPHWNWSGVKLPWCAFKTYRYLNRRTNPYT